MKKRKNNRKKKKIFGALALGMLLLSGGAFAIPFNNPSSLPHAESFKQIKDNPTDFLRMNRIEFGDSFDYIDEMNREFSENSFNKSNSKDSFKEKSNSKNVKAESELLKAIQNEDYLQWRNALKDLEGYPEGVGVISEDDFKILVKVHKDGKDL